MIVRSPVATIHREAGIPGTFMGFPRAGGRPGIRNLVVVLPLVAGAHVVAQRIAARVPGTIAVPYLDDGVSGREDESMTDRVLIGAAAGPNVAAVLMVGLADDGRGTRIAGEALRRSPGRPVESISIDGSGGSLKAIVAGAGRAKSLVDLVSDARREEYPVSELIMAAECGGSDATSGMASNPVVGVAADILIDLGGTVCFSETTEMMGAEHILARRACNDAVARRIIEIVANVEKAANAVGATVAGGNPTPGNMAGGLSTIEEKSLGCILKGGTRPVQGVLDFAEPITGRGLWLMDTPGHDAVSVSAKAAGGSHLNVFTTGRGSPLGNAIQPVMKVCANAATVASMSDNFDFTAEAIIAGRATKEQLGRDLYRLVIETCSGRPVAAEVIGHHEFAIHHIGILD
jgi:altronate dehydratase large subunit